MAKPGKAIKLSTEADIRWSVSEFSKDMERKLNLNKNVFHKSDPAIGEEGFLFGKLKDELHELYEELFKLENINHQNVIDECADISNFAMMIALLAKKQL